MRYTRRNFKYEEGSPMERLQELENKLDDGYLLEAPCKIGDTVYAVAEAIDTTEEEYEIYAYKAEGVMWDGKTWNIIDDSELINELGTEWAILDRTEAEHLLMDRRMGK